MKKSFVVLAIVVLWGAAGLAEAGVVHDFSFSYSGPGVSGSGDILAMDNGDGTFLALSGTGYSPDAGILTLDPPGNSPYRNGNGDDLIYDNILFSPGNPSLDDNGIVFLGTTLPVSPFNVGAFNIWGNGADNYSYFAGWSNYFTLTSFTLTDKGPLVPEPATIVSGAIGALTVLGYTLARRRKMAAV